MSRLRPTSRFALVLLLVLGAPVAVSAAVPSTMNLQGSLATANGFPFEGTVNVTVRLYTTQVGGTAVYAPPVFAGVVVTRGIYDLNLGPLPDGLFKNNSALWLEMTVNAEAPLPRRQILPEGYAFHAKTAEEAAVSNDLLCSGCVASTDLGSNLTLVGNLTVGQSLLLCNGGAGTCYVQLTDTTRIAADGTGTTVQSNGGMKVRNAGNTAWTPLQSGPLTATGNSTVNGNLAVTGTISGTISSVPWSALTGLPAGFADGVDNDTITSYTPGTGLSLTGTQFSVDTTVMQKRVSATCPSGQAIRAVNVDGTVVCGAAGATLTAPATGGLAINASNEVSLALSCSAGQLLKWDGTKWKCDVDASSAGVTQFSQLGGTASDAQIPDSVTINWAKDADKVDGHHYSSVWDSTDAATLGGQPPAYYATKESVDTLASQVSTPPAVQQTICDSSLPTRVCKRDVYMFSTHEKDAGSLDLLYGGAWVYHEAENRCEYQGGIEVDAPKECGQDLMPHWMDTTDECGGFRQSTWDTRVRFAVSKSNVWDKEFAYTCPVGYHWATTDEVKPWFNGPNTGVYVYQNQCGWQGYYWGGKRRYYFRFKDSNLKQASYKHAGNYDPYTVEYSNTTADFAGIVCVQDAPPGKLDWMITEDACGGFKQSQWDPRFWFAVSRKTVFDKAYDYQCPDGFHWATTAETYEAFDGTLNQGYLYYGLCGWSGYDMHANGLTRYYFRMKDSFKDATTLAYKHAGNADMYTVQFNDATLGNFAGIVCKDDNYQATPTDWMDTTDHCGGFRQSTWDPRFSYAVSKKNTWDKNFTYTCPTGYHWASTAEVDAAFTASNGGDQYVYHNQCGWSGYIWNGVQRYAFRMSDSKTNNRYTHAGWYDPYKGSTYAGTEDFGGIICKKDGTAPYPTPGTTDWMQTNDDCGGFRQSNWDSRIRYAVARQNVWNKAYDYKCPTGYHWGTYAEVQGILNGPNTNYYRYNGQCGWSGYYWNNRYRVYFRYKDSATNNQYAHAAHGDPYGAAGADGTLTSFAGVVCVADAAPTDPTDWMDKSDNCGGFRQSSWDPRVHFAVSKRNAWNKSYAYQCPSGHHWMSTLEAQTIFTGANIGPAYTYHSQCGWSGYNWHGMDRYYFRLSDSAGNNVFKHSGNYDPYMLQTDATLTGFAGIVCLQDTAGDPTAWMDKTDNCGGFRQSISDPDVFYAVSKSNIWNKSKTYACPSGYHWATTAEGTARFNNVPAYPYNVYNAQCGWSGYEWNDAWPFGCTSYGGAGCGSTYLSPTPTMYEKRLGTYESGCDECETYYATTCQAAGIASGPDGKCGGIDEAHWRNDQHLDDCYYSPNNFGGNPLSMTAGTNGDHCNNGVCCGDAAIQNLTKTRYYFRFKDSVATGAFKHAGNNENYVVQYGFTESEFAGVVCIKD